MSQQQAPKIRHVPPSRVPRFRNGTSHTWDPGVRVTLPDGSQTNGWVESTWGAWVYFKMDGRWCKASVLDLEDNWRIDLRPEG